MLISLSLLPFLSLENSKQWVFVSARRKMQLLLQMKPSFKFQEKRKRFLWIIYFSNFRLPCSPFCTPTSCPAAIPCILLLVVNPALSHFWLASYLIIEQKIRSFFKCLPAFFLIKYELEKLGPEASSHSTLDSHAWSLMISAEHENLRLKCMPKAVNWTWTLKTISF